MTRKIVNGYTDQKATSQELVELFSCDDIEELWYDIAKSHVDENGETFRIQACAGYWEYVGEQTWKFVEDLD